METELAMGHSIPFLIVDYSELLQSQFSDPTQASAEVIQGLREIANEMNKLVLVLLQPNKMSSNPTEPLLSYNCAKGSSSIAQAVTMMITAHRPGYSSSNPENDRFFSINCVKNRMGPLFETSFSWHGPTGKITQLDDKEREFLNQLRDMKKEEKEEKKKSFRDF
jgi:replicative DNA helicase